MYALYSEQFMSINHETFQLTSDMETFLNTDGVNFIRLYLTSLIKYKELNLDEMIQECLIDVARALSGWDLSYEASKNKITSIVYVCCKNRVQMEYRKLHSEKSKTTKRAVSYESLASIDEESIPGNLIFHDEVLDDFIIYKDQLAWLREAIDRVDSDLSAKEHSIIKLTSLGYSQQEIAKMVGISQSHVSVKKHSAIRKLGAMLQRDRMQGANV